jgi:hypothetical protein
MIKEEIYAGKIKRNGKVSRYWVMTTFIDKGGGVIQKKTKYLSLHCRKGKHEWWIH